MGYDSIKKLIADNQNLSTLITNLTNGGFGTPYIMQSTLEILDDTDATFKIIPDGNKIALCNMLNMYFKTCYFEYIDTKLKNYEKLVEFAKVKLYEVDAACGKRSATVNEIAQGVKGLVAKDIYTVDEDKYKLLCLLQWTFTGKPYYFKQAGYTLEYDSNGEVTTLFYSMVFMCSKQLLELFKWVGTDDFDSCIKKIKKFKAGGGLKYATYEVDEITEEITIKQLVQNIHSKFPRNSDNIKYRRALALSIKYDKKLKYGTKYIEPLDIAFMRQVYDEYIQSLVDVSQRDTMIYIKEKCEKLLNDRYSGLINQEHFVYKIIPNLQKNNYTKVSVKQLRIIDDAYGVLESAKEKLNTNYEAVIDEDEIDNSLQVLSDAIGNGLFEDAK